MKKILLNLIFLGLLQTAHTQINIPATTIITENFNSIGTAGSATLPANWKMSSAGTGAVSNWTTGTNITATTQAASSGTPTSGGAYNWASTGGTDRAIGFMTDGSYTSPNSIMAYYRNTTGAIVTTLTISFTIERYRINSSPFSLSFFSSTDGNTWTARTGGDVSTATFTTAASSYSFTNPQTIFKTVTITGLNITNNADFYLRWLINTSNASSQGLALDNVAIYAGAATPNIMASMRDAISIDGGIINQANPGDQLTYTTTIKNTGTGDANNVNLTAPAPTNTTLVGGSVKTSALARNDSYSTPFNTVLNASAVLANDYGLPSVSLISFGSTANPVTIVNGTNSAGTDNGGTVVMNTDGTFTYTPPAGFTGYDKFAYIAGTGTLPNNDAIVTIAVGTAASATNDSYNVIGNVSIAPSAGAGVLSNDAGTGITITAVNGSPASVGAAILTANGGNLTVNADGSFNYNPPPGFEGADNFTYTIDNGFSSQVSATVTLNVSGMIWFITNGGAAGDGRLSSPFNSIAAFQALNTGGGTNPDQQDYIFMYENASGYTGSFSLLNGQKIIGQDATASLASITGYTVPSYSTALPAMNSGNGTIVNLTTTVAGTHAINLNVVGGSNLIRGLTIGNTTGAAITGSGFGTVTIADVSITGTGQCLSLGNGTANASFNTLSSSSSTTAISLINITGTITATGGTISGSTGTAISINGGTVSFTYPGNITQASNAALVGISGGHTAGTIAFNTGTLSTTNGSGLQFDNADGIYNFSGTTTLNGGDAGIDIVNGSSGTFTFGSATGITNPTGTAFVISASNCNGTYNGSITDNTGYVVSVDNFNAGTFTFQTGTISSTAQGIMVFNNSGGTLNFDNTGKTLNTGANTAITLTNNGSSNINFRNGGLVITTTTGMGINATAGAGGITVTGNGNTINSGTATSLNIANSTIGAAGLNFQSISSSGGTATGIILDNTGTLGGLTVTGDGVNTTTGGNITGGVISNKSGVDGSTSTGIGIYLNNTRNITLRRMTINGINQNFGILANNTTNLVIEYSTINGTNGNNVAVTPREGSVILNNLFGNCSVLGSIISGGIEDNLRVENTSGTLTSFNLSNSTISNNSTVSGNIGFRFATVTAGVTMNGTVNNCLFQGNRTDAINCDASNGNVSVTITNNTIIAGTGGNNQGNLGINVTAANSGVMNYVVDNNKVGTDGVTNAPLINTGINIFAGGSTCSMSGTVKNNTVRLAGAGFSGFGISVFSSGSAAPGLTSITATVTGNTVTNVGLDYGIRCEASGSSFSSTLKLRLSGNNVSVLSTALDCIRVQARNTSTICGIISGNTTNSGGSGFVGLFVRQANTAVFQLEGLAAGSQTAATTQTYITAQNPGAATIGAIAVTNFTGVTSGFCAVPN
jgi:hypothetical protein